MPDAEKRRTSSLASPTCRQQPMFDKLGWAIPRAIEELFSACSH